MHVFDKSIYRSSCIYFPNRNKRADRYFGNLEFFFIKTEFTSYFMFNSLLNFIEKQIMF